MARTDLELDEELEESGGGFSRFLFFATPILFTVVLLGVMLTLFNMDFRNMMYRWADAIPVVRDFVPDPERTEDEQEQKLAADKEKELKEQQKSIDAAVKQLQEQVAKQDTDLQTAAQQAEAQQAKVKELEEQLAAAQVQKQVEEEKAEAEAYQKEVKKLAQLYSGMSPSKAAAIFDKLTTEETVQMLNAMNNEGKVAILEKMNPQKAADISIKLKDVKEADDLAIAALQSRLKKEAETDQASSTTGTALDDTELSQTFSAMPAAEAAKLVLQTYKISPDKGLRIMKSVNSSARSDILAEMTKADEKTSVKILNQLVSK
ncbi:MotE family protein [Paenibacillus senegalimassiliensis]|uniref:MotE family protein n=1 Tax=Paenibacillus senegalimassiliensis TaxID=1737426 RepID=UPI00073FA495|nr:hypothetical protein [Paenibacillus senegalimassiliensis]